MSENKVPEIKDKDLTIKLQGELIGAQEEMIDLLRNTIDDIKAKVSPELLSELEAEGII